MTSVETFHLFLRSKYFTLDSYTHCREKELEFLNEFYQKDGLSMTIIYGRRRIGKSTLISEFIKDKRTIFYTATKVGKERNLELFSQQVLYEFMPDVEDITFHSLEAVFNFIDKNIKKKLILVIEKFQII